ncbi:hypothetical protein ANN_18419 [Periplaneta americana]|uniref:Uncharacterized protein n=1 Tax=Periplaneta americana TaxID=6978 RepID=A0ABQ8SPY9_PERAM|nr:hypothetical protein ANN_18419 [Periplaneta americana]
MAGLCEGGNEPPGFLKASSLSKPQKGNIGGGRFDPVLWIEFGVAQWSERLVRRTKDPAMGGEMKGTEKLLPMIFSLTPPYKQTQSKALSISGGF